MRICDGYLGKFWYVKGVTEPICTKVTWSVTISTSIVSLKLNPMLQLESVAKISNLHYIEAFQCIGNPIH